MIHVVDEGGWYLIDWMLNVNKLDIGGFGDQCSWGLLRTIVDLVCQ